MPGGGSTAKIAIGTKNLFLPSPVTLVGTLINDRPNYLAVAWCSIVNNMPPLASISLYHIRYTRAGIKENGTFSINVPSARQVKETDYCGIFSGKHRDKSQVFESFFGRLKTAPLIRSCPINMECKLHSTFNIGTHDLYVGEIVEIYVDEEYMADGMPDMKSIDPMVCTWKGNYWHVGDVIARTFDAGKDYK
jgi:flavin reductase (DIM6/NTAB) family NADH-FMN oxidoreductase RutF